jgi:hypothetical protein
MLNVSLFFRYGYVEVVSLLDIPSSSYLVFTCFHEAGYVATSFHDDMIYVYMVSAVQIVETAVSNSMKVNGNLHVHVGV